MVPGLIGKVVSGNWLSKHGLLTAFFPNLTLWIIVVGLLWARIPNKPKELASNEGAAWSFLLVAWVMACSFLTINFQPRIQKALRGDADPGGPLGWLVELRRRYWRTLNRQQKEADHALEQLQLRLDPLKDSVDRLCAFKPAKPDTPLDGGDAARVIDVLAVLDTSLARPDAVKHQRAIALLESDASLLRNAADILDGVAVPTDGRKPTATAVAKAAKDKPARSALALTLRTAASRVRARIEFHIAAIESDRDWARSSSRLIMPLDASYVGPTRLGNVFRATEEALVARYGLRPWLLASHLRAVLPAGHAEGVIEDARLGLDLSATLSAMILLFGSLVAFLTAMSWPTVSLFSFTHTFSGVSQVIAHAWGVLVLGAIVAFAVDFIRDLRGQRSTWQPWLAGAAAASALAITIPSPRVDTPLGGLVAFVVLTAVAAAASHMAYVNAVSAAIAYCNSVEALFDQHRARILTALRLRIPTTIDDERRLWTQLCQQLDRPYSGSVDPRFVSFTTDPATALPAVHDDSPAQVVVGAARPLDSLTTLTANDLVTVTIWGAGTPHDVGAQDSASLIGKRLLAPARPGDPIRLYQVADPRDVAGRVLVSIPAAACMLPPDLRTGDRVSVLFVTAGRKATAVVDDLVVVSVVHRPAPSATDTQASRAIDALLTVLVPRARRTAIAKGIASGSAPVLALTPVSPQAVP